MNPVPVTKEKLRFVKSLLLKKNRIENGAFLVEGLKSVLELLKSPFDISFLVATQACLDENSAILNQTAVPLFVAKVSDIERSGSLKTNNSIIAVAKSPENKPLRPNSDEYLIALDDVRDPGNLGTIMRVADWFGISGLLLSKTCVDPFNPKSVIASMGSFTRVSVFQTDLVEYLATLEVKKIATTMDGENIHTTKVEPPAVIILGNESNGLSLAVLELTNHKITIPKFGNAESLNVAMAASIICDNLRRS